MNVLVVSEFLLSSLGKLYEPQVILMLTEIYLSGKFDMMLLLETSKTDNSKVFNFAKIYHRHFGKVDCVLVNANMIFSAIKDFSSAFDRQCLFVITCINNHLLPIATIKNIEELVCFMVVDDNTNDRNFHKINISPQIHSHHQNYFMGKYAQYNNENDEIFAEKYLKFDINKF